MIVLLNKYLLVNLLFLLFLFFTFTISHIKTVVLVKDDNEFFGIFPENYYDPRDYGEEIPSFSDQLGKIDSRTTAVETELNNTLSSKTIDDNYEKSSSLSTTTINSLPEDNYSNDINFIAAGDWNCNKKQGTP
jgi:hypothetical protein